MGTASRSAWARLTASSFTSAKTSRPLCQSPQARARATANSMPYSLVPGMPTPRAFLKMLPLRRTRTSLMSPRLSSWARDTARAMAAGSVQPRAGLTLRLSKETRWSRYMFFPFRADDVLKALRQPRGRTPRDADVGAVHPRGYWAPFFSLYWRIGAAKKSLYCLSTLPNSAPGK